jgi:hypothetical protein
VAILFCRNHIKEELQLIHLGDLVAKQYIRDQWMTKKEKILSWGDWVMTCILGAIEKTMS